MVSIRRRKLLGTCSGRNSLLAQLPWTNSSQNSTNNTKSPRVYLLPLNNAYKQKKVIASETWLGSSNGSASSPSKEHCFPEIKRRKQHRRKHVENQEACIMRGVYYKNLKWQAAIKVDKKQIHLGTVSSQEEAARLYDRAAFMCGREPNFELSEEEKKELQKFNWDEFLAMTRSTITSKKSQRRSEASQRKHIDNDFLNSFSAASDEDVHH